MTLKIQEFIDLFGKHPSKVIKDMLDNGNYWLIAYFRKDVPQPLFIESYSHQRDEVILTPMLDNDKATEHLKRLFIEGDY